METLIQTILANNDYAFDENINGYRREDTSYFFIKSIDTNQLEDIKNKSSLNESEWHREFLSQFNNACSSPNYPALAKNSSLIVLVNSTSIMEIERLQSQILLIEEDQFYVKKYVVVYTTDALGKILEFTSNEDLQAAINNRTTFQSILTNGFNQENEDYVLLLQLFIKLPFLTLKFTEDVFVTLPVKLNKALGNDYTIFQQLLSSSEQLQNIDFISLESENEIDNLLTLLTNDQN